MWATRIELKDWAINTLPPPQLSRAQLLAWHDRGIFLHVTGSCVVCALFLEGSAPSPALVSAVVEHLPHLQYSLQIATGLVLFSCLQNRSEMKRVVQYMLGHADELPHLLRIGLQHANDPESLKLFAKAVAAKMEPRQVDMFLPYLDYLFEALYERKELESFVRQPSRFLPASSSHSLIIFGAFERLFDRNARHPVALLAVKLSATVLLELDVDSTVQLLLGLPKGRRLLLNLVHSMELEFTDEGRVPRQRFDLWLRVLSSATRSIGALLDDDEAARHHVKDFHYLGRFLPLYDHIISEPGYAKSTVTAALEAMRDMARISHPDQCRATLHFMQVHQPNLTAIVWRDHHED